MKGGTMENIAIVTDTTSDIPDKIVKKYKIIIVPLYVGFGGKLYLEGKEITSKEVYEKLLTGERVHTSTPSVGDFMEVYRNLIEKEKKTLIYSIHVSSKLSATINSAEQAKKFFPKARIKIVDSKTAAINLGFIVLGAARAASRGESEERIDSIIDFAIRKNKMFATFENFEYLFRGGRAPFLGKFLARSIILKPIITIGSDGKVKLKKFTRNKRNSIIELYQQIRKDPFYTGKKKIGIFYGSDINPALELKKMVKEDSRIKIDELILTEVTTVMSAHTGPGIWGVSSCPVIPDNKKIGIGGFIMNKDYKELSEKSINELKEALKDLSFKSKEALKYASKDLTEKSRDVLKNALKNLTEKSKDVFDDISEKSKDTFDSLSKKGKLVTKELSERGKVTAMDLSLRSKEKAKDLSGKSKQALKKALSDLSEKSKAASKDLSDKSKKALKEALIKLADKIE
jgi:DegV family protein with EDD domain